MTAPEGPGPTEHQLNPRNVTMVNGQTTQVMTDDEAVYYETSRDAYMEQLKFTENTDRVDLDRLLVLELMIFRWQQWLFSGKDYEGDFIDDEKRIIDTVKLYSDQINKIKEQMGLTKKARDAHAADGNFAQWLADLKVRAKAFGIHREKQHGKAMVLMNELSAIIGGFDRSDEEERRKLGFLSEKDIVGWVRTTMLPEYKALDEHFRETEQRFWVRDM